MNDDGSIVAYAARRGKEHFGVVGREPGPPYRNVRPPIVRGRHVAFVAEDDRGMFVVVDGRPGPVHKSVGDVALDATGRCAYVADSSVVLDGIRGPSYDRITRPVFFPDGTLAYGARRGGRWLVVHNGREMPAAGEVSTVFPGGHVLEEGRGFRIADGPAFDWIGWPAKLRDGRIVYFAARGSKKFLVVADREIDLGECIVWSPRYGDGEVTFVARIGLEVWQKTIRF
jgi:hypothetical protein